MTTTIQYIIHREHIKHAQDIIKYKRMTNGIHRTKEQTKDKKYNDYCKEYNRTHTDKIYNTNGAWKPNKKHAMTRTLWQKYMEQNEKLYPAHKEEPKRTDKYEVKNEIVILWDGTQAKIYYGDTEHTGSRIILKLKAGRRKFKIHAHIAAELWAENAPKTVIAEGQTITTQEFLKQAITHHTQIYTFEYIEQ